MKFNLIACVNLNNVLGKDNNLLYYIPNDMKNFKTITEYGGVVIMGKNTFNSLPNRKPLKNRINIIITHNVDDFILDEEYDNVFVVDSIDMAIDYCKAYYSDKECFVIGGASIYSQFLEKDIIDDIYLTIVNEKDEGDVLFPTINTDKYIKFYESCSQRYRTIDNDITYKFLIYRKKN